MNDTNAAPTIRYMVRCKHCNVTARVDVPARYETKTETRRVLGERGWESESYSRKIKVADLGQIANAYLYGAIGHVLAGCRHNCWTCGYALKFDRIKGTFKPEHKCNAKCLASKGPLCECSCGGDNHGKSYA